MLRRVFCSDFSQLIKINPLENLPLLISIKRNCVVGLWTGYAPYHGPEVAGIEQTRTSTWKDDTMIKQLPLLFAATIIFLISGCSETPTEAGASMARSHLELGANPSPRAKAEMQAEVNRKASDYNMREMQEFMQAYLTTIMEESPAMIQLQGKAMEELGKAMQNRANWSQ